ncbi:MAG: DNA-directed RNA polymerase subunit alpha C-terminal domain-containing protein [Patescibacteria group bacterium]
MKSKLNGKDFSVFMGICGVDVPALKTDDLDRPLNDLEWSVRTENCLKNENIKTVGDLVRQTEVTLLRIPNFGRKGIQEVKEVLASIGHDLGELPYEPKVVGGTG